MAPTRQRGPAYHLDLERRREATREAQAARLCLVCGASLAGHRSSSRYCSGRCSRRAEYLRTRPATVRARVPRQPRAELPAVPVLEVHPLLEAAVAALRPYERAELGTDFDSVARDLVSEHVLAALEGSSPAQAMAAARARHQRDRVVLVHGLGLVDGLER